jgi:hypothetical protein
MILLSLFLCINKLKIQNMKNVLLLLTLLLSISNITSAQKVTKTKWHTYYIGGKKYYFVKTHEFTPTTLTENQTGSGGQFDNSPVKIKIVQIVTTSYGEKVITEYGDSSYYVISFKNITNNKAEVCKSSTELKTKEEAIAYEPDSSQYSTWYTKAGIDAENKKPVMKTFTKQNALEISKMIANAAKDMKSKINGEEDGLKKFGMALVLSTLPSNYAQKKGFHAYKSLVVIDKGMNKFKNDPDVKKILKDAGLDD